MKDLKAKWDALPKQHQKAIIIGAIVVTVMIIGLVGGASDVPMSDGA